ncbi:MAG: DNA-directed RNA polymerase subunit P [Candidatus Micrarchaeota archaeon]|nr:DNA-directed RNA polymerase subunit P [Candidatus Micrarchaeota archaeon]
MYRCLNCKREIELEQVKEKIRCPYCGYRILAKQPGAGIIKVKAK